MSEDEQILAALDRYIDDHLDESLADLTRLTAIPSVSSKGEHMDEAARYVAELLEGAGFTTQILPTEGFPVVYGDSGTDSDEQARRTLLCYNHYDVQPEEPLDLWESPPFAAEVRDGRIYGRGISDDKGQVISRIAAMRAVRAVTGGYPARVKFAVEGEEEIGSPHLPGYVGRHARELACDLVISADGAQWRPDEPSLSVASKGLVAFTITVEGARDDLHSGRYGGTVANPAQALAAILASLHHPDGSVAVDRFYDGVTPPSPRRLAELDAVPFDDEVFAAQTGVSETWGEAGPVFRYDRWRLSLGAYYQGFSGTETDANPYRLLDFSAARSVGAYGGIAFYIDPTGSIGLYATTGARHGVQLVFRREF